MGTIRAIWQISEALDLKLESELKLHILERRIAEELESFSELSRLLCDSAVAAQISISQLYSNAENDLVAGCELARNGYFKQAYALWRSWFEQAVFGLFFVESPIHSHAWSGVDSLTLENGPDYRLMLHQLLANGRDGHPFAVVFGDRFQQILIALKLSNVPKKRYVLNRAERVLTALSQGVHGTYRPKRVASPDQACEIIESESLPVLKEAFAVVGLLWCMHFISSLTISEQEIVDLRAGNLSLDSGVSLQIGDCDFSGVSSSIASAEKVVQFMNKSFSDHFGAI
ncbi:hypothetical protein [Stenotrophomonas acidaminiphila]|uniref:hypothetical protein n=1 Tax=Stenotrophomonas acidaminiphila TaxID=128780 RepID=UPI0028B089F5|nr:hypothetical protein [Stenotrophomonas acidaminiphila]